jgi:peptidoglycan/LPS O-acetylase OafA/YrhL
MVNMAICCGSAFVVFYDSARGDHGPLISIGEKLRLNSGIGPGFDAMRVALSCGVLCWHSLPISYGGPVEHAVWTSAVGRPFMAIMPIFFALSGFLVMGSALRLSALGPYLLSRGLRIVPALATEITVSAILIGGALTALPWHDYFTNKGLLEYFGSLVGRVVFELPGVQFAGNAYAIQVNNNLWTIPPELLCYVFMSLLIVLGLHRSRWSVVVCAIAIVAANVIYDGAYGPNPLDARWPARHLVLAFAVGAAAYMVSDRLPYSRWIAIGAAILGLVLLRMPYVMYLGIVALVYVTAFLGATRLPLPGLFKTGDYSYGIYLYGFPIQQLVTYLLPLPHEFYWNLLFALPITVGVAVLSWHLIEKPALSLRRRIVRHHGGQPVSPLATFLVLILLQAYAVFLMRFSFIAFFEQTSVAYLLKIAIVVAATSAIGATARYFALNRINLKYSRISQ